MHRVFWSLLATDLVTKQIAAWWLPVVYNTDASKIGLEPAGHVTISIMLAMFFWEIGKRTDVPGIGRYAACAVSGTIGNLLSYVWGPPGVLDFIYIPGVGVANFADFAIWVGVAGVFYLVARQALTQPK